MSVLLQKREVIANKDQGTELEEIAESWFVRPSLERLLTIYPEFAGYKREDVFGLSEETGASEKDGQEKGGQAATTAGTTSGQTPAGGTVSGSASTPGGEGSTMGSVFGTPGGEDEEEDGNGDDDDAMEEVEVKQLQAIEDEDEDMEKVDGPKDAWSAVMQSLN
jgi:hypothetical protein